MSKSIFKFKPVEAIGATPKDVELEGEFPGGGGSGVKTAVLDLTNNTGTCVAEQGDIEILIPFTDEQNAIMDSLTEDNPAFYVTQIVNISTVDKIEFSGSLAETIRQGWDQFRMMSNLRYYPLGEDAENFYMTALLFLVLPQGVRMSIGKSKDTNKYTLSIIMEM